MELMVEFPKDSPLWWTMLEDQQVKDLQKQLSDGLLHPLEFAYAVVRIGSKRYALPEGVRVDVRMVGNG